MASKGNEDGSFEAGGAEETVTLVGRTPWGSSLRCIGIGQLSPPSWMVGLVKDDKGVLSTATFPAMLGAISRFLAGLDLDGEVSNNNLLSSAAIRSQ